MQRSKCYERLHKKETRPPKTKKLMPNRVFFRPHPPTKSKSNLIQLKTPTSQVGNLEVIPINKLRGITRSCYIGSAEANSRPRNTHFVKPAPGTLQQVFTNNTLPGAICDCLFIVLKPINTHTQRGI